MMPAKWGLLLNTGLVEGIAVAADWGPDSLNPHAASAALRGLKLAPEMKSILNASGFWAQPSRRAYVMTGSFVRWLVDEYGISAFKRIYANEEWEAVYGKTVDTLTEEWEAFIDTIPVDGRAKSLALHRYDRRSIFQKACARSIAELRRKARLARNGDFFDQAAALQRRILEYQPQDKRAILTLAAILTDAGELDAASSVLDRLKEKDLNPSLVARLKESRGDIAWLGGNTEAALESYEKCLGLGVSDSGQRLLTSKSHGIAQGSAEAKAYLFGKIDQAWLLQRARSWAEADPDDPMPKYLVGLQLKAMGDYTQALEWLSGPPLEQEVLEEERRRLLAETAHHLGLYASAESVWTTLLDSSSPRLRALAIEGVERVGWRRSNFDWIKP